VTQITEDNEEHAPEVPFTRKEQVICESLMPLMEGLNPAPSLAKPTTNFAYYEDRIADLEAQLQ